MSANQNQFIMQFMYSIIFLYYHIIFFPTEKDNGPNHLLLTMLQTFVWQHCQWHCLQKYFCLKLPNSVRNAKKFLEAMPLAMLPTKSLQHCQEQMIWANENGNNQSYNIGPNHLVLTMLQTFVWQHCQWHCLQKCFCISH